MESSEDLGQDGLEMVEMGPGWWKKRFGKRADTRHFLKRNKGLGDVTLRREGKGSRLSFFEKLGSQRSPWWSQGGDKMQHLLSLPFMCCT